MGSKGRGYRTYEKDGFEILVGKGDADNDRLTFGVAARGARSVGLNGP